MSQTARDSFTTESASQQVSIAARELCISTAPTVARPQVLSFEADTGDLLVVEGRAHSGKTALLLTLAGRMKPESGELRVLGYPLPAHARAVRAISGLGIIRGVNDLDPSLTVEQHIAERILFQQPRWRAGVSRATVGMYLNRANAVLGHLGASPLVPPSRTSAPSMVGSLFVEDLSPLDRLVLGTTLALIGDPQLVIIDDIDTLREHNDRIRAWSALLALVSARRSLTVVASCEDASELSTLTTRDPAKRLARTRVKIVRMTRAGPG